MELPIKPSSKNEPPRSCSLVFIRWKVSDNGNLWSLVAVYGENVMLLQKFRKRCQQFKVRWEWIDDEPRAGHPIDVHTDKNRHLVEKLILSDHWVSVTKLAVVTGLARCQIYQFIHKPNFRKICTRWLPKMPTEDHLMKRRARCL